MINNNRKAFHVLVGLALVVAIFALGYHVGQDKLRTKLATGGEVNGLENPIPEFLADDVEFDLFWQAWQHVKDFYVDDDIPDTQLLYGAITGLINSLDDPYSNFLNPEVAEDFAEELSGRFEGIGAEISIKNNQLVVIAPLPDSPAQNAGLQPGDAIVLIDEEETFNISLFEAVQKIRGPQGTSVILTVVREGADEPIEISIKRSKIVVSSVTWEQLPNDIVHIKLRYFNDRGSNVFGALAKEVRATNPAGIVLDVRNNPGGFLNVAVDVAGLWLGDELVVSERSRDGVNKEHRSDRFAALIGIPTVVLINEGSASASEIVAGALQDHEQATIVGEQSFGKGSVQDLRAFKGGSAIKLTIAEWLTPLGRSINDEGISPDIEIELTQEDYDADRDPQLDKAVEILEE
ncbi:peptidase S41 [bacterium]|nr:peptidase S41 [bacterium]